MAAPDARGALLRPGEADELRHGIEDNLVTLGATRLAAVNLRVMDPAEPPGSRFDAQLAALVRVREEGLIGGVGLSNISRRHLLRAVAQTAPAPAPTSPRTSPPRTSGSTTRPAFSGKRSIRRPTRCRSPMNWPLSS